MIPPSLCLGKSFPSNSFCLEPGSAAGVSLCSGCSCLHRRDGGKRARRKMHLGGITWWDMMSCYRQQLSWGPAPKTGARRTKQLYLHMAMSWTFLSMAPFTFPASLIAGLVMGADTAWPTYATLLAKYSQVFFTWWPQGIAWCFPCWNTTWMKVLCAVPWLVAAGLLTAWRYAHKSGNRWAHFWCRRSPQISS